MLYVVACTQDVTQTSTEYIEKEIFYISQWFGEYWIKFIWSLAIFLIAGAVSLCLWVLPM